MPVNRTFSVGTLTLSLLALDHPDKMRLERIRNKAS